MAREQKERSKQEQKSRKEEARRQKEQAKQQEKQKKEQARQEKERKKQEQEPQKEARNKENAKTASNDAAQKPTDVPRASQPHASPASAYRTPEASEISGHVARSAVRLTRNGSDSVVHQVNALRSGMNGVNDKALPPEDVTVHANDRLTVNASGGRQYGVRSDGTLA